MRVAKQVGLPLTIAALFLVKRRINRDVRQRRLQITKEAMLAVPLFFLPPDDQGGTANYNIRRIARSYESAITKRREESQISDSPVFPVEVKILTNTTCMETVAKIDRVPTPSQQGHISSDLHERLQRQFLEYYKQGRTSAISKKAADDLCVLAALYLHGGYFFGPEISFVLSPFLLNQEHEATHNELVAVKEPCHKKNDENMAIFKTTTFLAASAPGNPLLRNTLEEFGRMYIKEPAPDRSPSMMGKSSSSQFSSMGSVALTRAYRISPQNVTGKVPAVLRPMDDLPMTPTVEASPMRVLRDRIEQNLHFVLSDTRFDNMGSGAIHNGLTDGTTNIETTTRPSLNSFNVQIKFVFLVGIEGTGHHLYEALLQSSPALRLLKDLELMPELTEIQQLIFDFRNKPSALFTAPFAEDKVAMGRAIENKLKNKLQQIWQKIENRMQTREKNRNNQNDRGPVHNEAFTKVVTVPFNGMSFRGVGQLSYPNFLGEFNTLQYPDLRSLYKICNEAHVDCGHVYVTRDPYEVMRSTAIKRQFRPLLSQLVEARTMLSVIEGQLYDFPDRLWGCLDYDRPDSLVETLGVSILRWPNANSFRSFFYAMYEKPKEDSDKPSYKNSIVPLKHDIYMKQLVLETQKVMKVCERIVGAQHVT